MGSTSSEVEMGRSDSIALSGREDGTVGKRVVDVDVLRMSDYECLCAAAGSIE